MHNSCWCHGHQASSNKPGLLPEILYLTSNIAWHHTNWWPLGAFVPSGKILNTTLMFCNFSLIASRQKSIAILGIQDESLLHKLSRWTTSFCTPINSQSKVHLHLWWNKKGAIFKFSWDMTETHCFLSCIQSEFLPPGFLLTLQLSLTFCQWVLTVCVDCLGPAL